MGVRLISSFPSQLGLKGMLRRGNGVEKEQFEAESILINNTRSSHLQGASHRARCCADHAVYGIENFPGLVATSTPILQMNK